MTSPLPDDLVFKHLPTPEADHLAELYLLQADLNASYETMTLYFEKYSATELSGDDLIISASLFRDAIVLFCGCFSTKDAVKPAPEAVYGHLNPWKEYYQAILDLRDAFVAHNFGPQRQHHVVAQCWEEKGRLRFDALANMFARFGGWGAEEGPKLLSFFDVARLHIKSRIEAAEAVVLAAANALTPEQLAELPEAGVTIPSSLDFRMSRSRFRESGRGKRQPLPRGRSFRISETD